MKKYIAPEAETEMLRISDIVTLSEVVSLTNWATDIDISNLDEWTNL